MKNFEQFYLEILKISMDKIKGYVCKYLKLDDLLTVSILFFEFRENVMELRQNDPSLRHLKL